MVLKFESWEAEFKVITVHHHCIGHFAQLNFSTAHKSFINFSVLDVVKLKICIKLPGIVLSGMSLSMNLTQ